MRTGDAWEAVVLIVQSIDPMVQLAGYEENWVEVYKLYSKCVYSFNTDIKVLTLAHSLVTVGNPSFEVEVQIASILY